MIAPATIGLAQAFRQARERTERIFGLIRPDAFLERPIPLRNPLVFYEGHLDAFNWTTLFRRALGAQSFNPAFDSLFQRGIDPELPPAAEATVWPDRSEIHAYRQEVNRRLHAFLDTFDPAHPPHPWLEGGHLLHILLEHELMHHETLLYLIHQLPESLKLRPQGLPPPVLGPAPPAQRIAVPAGRTRLGATPHAAPFAWDNELPSHEVDVPAFVIDATPVTNAQFLEFMDAGGYRRPELWSPSAWSWLQRNHVTHPGFWRLDADGWRFRGLFEELPLPMSWPAMVTHAEAEAFARSKGARLPTEAEWQRAAYGDDPERPYPWGWDPPTPQRANVDFAGWSPLPVGSLPLGASPWGIQDMVGNGWEWTSTPFAGYPGFQPDDAYPGYSADFFDGKHVVLKGGSWFTEAKLLRRSFRNWFFGHYPYAYTTFRCVS